MAKETRSPTQPFEKTIEHSMNLRDISFSEALKEVQDQYGKFTDRNQLLLERQNDQANHAQIQFISHFALLATLTLTVAGFLITQTTQSLTDVHKIMILVVIASETLSLFFGALDYWQTIQFHMKWSKAYQEIDSDVNIKITTGEIQYIDDLRKIEDEKTSAIDKSTNMSVTFRMVFFSLLGLMILITVYYAYFFDVPYWTYG